MKRRYFFDEIAVSAGIRGAQIIINGEALAEYLGAELIDLCFKRIKL